MHFNHYKTMRPSHFKGTSLEYILAALESPLTDREKKTWMLDAMLEARWLLHGRPFYNVYPIAIELCAKMALKMTWGDIKLPVQHLLLRFPCGHEPFGISSALIKAPSTQHDTTPVRFHETRARVISQVDRTELQGRTQFVDQSRDGSWCYVPQEGKPLSDKEVLSTVISLRDEFVDHKNVEADDFVIRFAAFLGLLANGHDLITPAILSSDREEYDATSDESRKRWLEARAASRQGVGFDVGRELEKRRSSSPHWRCPHLALFHTGPGRTVPSLRLRAGCVVVPRHFSEVPTGYMGSDDLSGSVCHEPSVFRPHVSKRLRFMVMRRDGFKCQLCGLQQSDGVRLEVDHKVPVAKGGATSPDNLWTLCHPCNNGKSDSDLCITQGKEAACP